MPLDSDLLRTFLAIADSGSVTAGANRIGRSQSATSLQVKQLENVVGCSLFKRHGRGVALTREGERLLPVARQVTDVLDASLAELRGQQLSGRLRIGIRDDHERMALTKIIAAFAARHPDVELQVQCTLGTTFESALKSGSLDMAAFEVAKPAEGDEILRSDRLIWMRSRSRSFPEGAPLPVAVFDQDCWWRDAALSGLAAAGRRYRIVFTSEGTESVRAAVRAGIAAGLLNAAEDSTGLVPMEDLREDRASYLILRRSDAALGDLADAMADAIRKVFAGHSANRSATTPPLPVNSRNTVSK